MAYSTNPASLRYNSLILYKKNNPVSNLKNVKISGILKSKFVEEFVLKYFTGILNSISVKEWILNSKGLNIRFSQQKTKKKLKSPTILGESRVVFKTKTMLVLLRFYLDYKNFSKTNLRDLHYNLNVSSKKLSKKFGVKVLIVPFNYFNVLLAPMQTYKHMFLNTNKANRRINLVKKTFINVDTVRESSFFKKVLYLYDFFIRTLSKYKANQYFFRIINVFFLAFLFKQPDLELMINALSFEISNLRKKQANFIEFAFSVIRLIFKVFKKRHRLAGFKLQFKGRIIPYNRERPRSLLKVILLGALHSTKLTYISGRISKAPSTRYGTVNISLHFAKKPQKYCGFFYPTESFLNSHSYLDPVDFKVKNSVNVGFYDRLKNKIKQNNKVFSGKVDQNTALYKLNSLLFEDKVKQYFKLNFESQNLEVKKQLSLMLLQIADFFDRLSVKKIIRIFKFRWRSSNFLFSCFSFFFWSKKNKVTVKKKYSNLRMLKLGLSTHTIYMQPSSNIRSLCKIVRIKAKQFSISLFKFWVVFLNNIFFRNIDKIKHSNLGLIKEIHYGVQEESNKELLYFFNDLFNIYFAKKKKKYPKQALRVDSTDQYATPILLKFISNKNKDLFSSLKNVKAFRTMYKLTPKSVLRRYV